MLGEAYNFSSYGAITIGYFFALEFSLPYMVLVSGRTIIESA